MLGWREEGLREEEGRGKGGQGGVAFKEAREGWDTIATNSSEVSDPSQTTIFFILFFLRCYFTFLENINVYVNDNKFSR